MRRAQARAHTMMPPTARGGRVPVEAGLAENLDVKALLRLAAEAHDRALRDARLAEECLCAGGLSVWCPPWRVG